jgi:tetratricopeptide (TPR) repeat protein
MQTQTRNIFGGYHSSRNAEAICGFELAVRAVAGHAPVAAALDAVTHRDPEFVAAHALRGLANVMAARHDTLAAARAGVAGSKAALAAAGGGTTSEHALVDAHALASEGRLDAAAARLEFHLDTQPDDVLALKIAHTLRFMGGDAVSMLASTKRTLRAISRNDAGFGYVLGCHAFALEETGDYRAAEAAGRRAVNHQPGDVWALHAVAHVMEMNGRTDEGIAWLQATAGTWPSCGGFGFHLAWHLALFHLAAGDYGQALALYDTHVQPSETCDFRDMANAASLLSRFEQHGLSVGDRWHRIVHIADKRRRDTTYVFASLHYLLVLCATGRMSAARDVVTALQASARSGGSDQSDVARETGAELASVILDYGLAHRRGTSLLSLASRLPRIGGSHAQRDVFLRTLMLLAADDGDSFAVSRLRALRSRQRTEDAFIDLALNRLRQGLHQRQSTHFAPSLMAGA